MKILSLNQKMINAFEGLDPLEVRKQKGFSADLMLGVVREDKEKNVPTGLLLGKTEKKELSLRWLFVDSESRRKNYAENLLSAAFHVAKERGMEQIRVHFPDVYGYKFFCRNDRSFFLNHGFRETKDGGMISTLEDYNNATEYSETYDPDDSDMLDRLLAMRVEDEEPEEEDTDLLFSELHKPWEVRSVGLRDFSKKPAVQNYINTALAGKKALVSGNIGELPFSRFRDGIELCEKNGHTGFLKSLYDTPIEYFNMEISSYTMADDQVNGMCLLHYNEKTDSLSLELIFTSDTDRLRGLAELTRIVLFSANKKYGPDTKLILPYDAKLHQPLIKKLIGELYDQCSEE